MSRQQLENDICKHLQARLERVVDDHLDTCKRMDIRRVEARNMAIAMLLSEAMVVVKAEGGSERDLAQICLLTLQAPTEESQC